MATDTPSAQSGEALNAQSDARASTESKRGLRKKAEMPPELDQLMKELAGDTSAGGASTIGRLERRVGVLEAAFADIVERHEISIRDRGAQLAAVEENVRALGNRIEASHRDHIGAAKELRTALGDIGVRLNGLEAQRQSAPVSIAPSPPAEPAAVETNAVADLTPIPQEDVHTSEGGADALQDAPPFEKRDFEGPAYLLAARRAANASIDIDRAGGTTPEAPRRASRTRLIFGGAAASLLVLAGAMFFINRHPVAAQSKAAPAAIAAAKQANAAPAKAAPALQTKLTPPPDVTAPADPMPADIISTVPSNELTEMASHGDAVAARDLGLKYLIGDGVTANDDEAASWILRAAYSGEPAAEYWLGALYASGRGLPEDATQALHWYEAAAKHGNGNAMHRLGLAYFKGQGVEKNDTEAARWFSQAADLGNADAAFNIAVLFERGAGVKQSFVEAYQWYAIAAHEGEKQAASRVEVLSKQLQPSELAAATHAAADFKPKSSSVASSK